MSNGPTLCFKRGDSFVFQGKVSESGSPVDITGWIIKSQVRNGPDVVETLTVEITDAAKGIFRAAATPAQTKDWPTNTLDFDIRYETAEGVVHTTPTGRVSVKPGGTYEP